MSPYVSKKANQPKRRPMSSAATLPTPQQGHNDHRPDDRHDDDAESGAVTANDVRSAPPTTIHRRQVWTTGSFFSFFFYSPSKYN
jgi:hypothetical protein